MKRSLVITMMIALMLAPLGAAYGKDEKSSKQSTKSSKEENSKSSVGTKELLARIEALEAAVAGLGGTDNSVGGHEYRILNFGSGIAAFIPFEGQFHLVFHSDRYLQFNTDGTGNRVTQFCDNQQLTVIAPNPPSLAPAGPGCTSVVDGAFTWAQSGNDVEISSGGPNPLLMTVSASGDTIIGGGLGILGTGNPFYLASGNIAVGVRLSN